MPLINCKVDLKLRCSNHCVLSVTGIDNANGNNDDNNIIFTIKDAIVPVVTLSARSNQKLSKLLGKGLERSVYWNEYKTKSENKKMKNEFRYFLESNLFGVNRLFVLVYINEINNAKRFNVRKYYLPKRIIENFNVIISGKNFTGQPINSGIKRHEETTKLTVVPAEDYTTGYLLDYDSKNHYRLIDVDLSRQKGLDADAKAIQQIEFVGQLK